MTSVDFTLWFTLTFVSAATLAEGVVGPLVELAAEQARLNAESVSIVEAATAACAP